MSNTTKRVFFPATRFIPDVDEKGVIKVNRTGEYLSGTFEIQIFEAVKEASIYIVGYSEAVSYNKYRVINEETRSLNVDQLVDYFNLREKFENVTGISANTNKEDTAKNVTTQDADKDAEIEDLKKKLAAAERTAGAKTDEKESAIKSPETSGKADGKSGAKAPEQTGKSSDKADAEKK